MSDKDEMPRTEDTDLPTHVVETVQDLAALHSAHRDNLGHAERAIRMITQRVGRPTTLIVFLTVIVFWISLNNYLSKIGAFDPAPFVYLQTACTIVSVSLTILILITQQRDDAVMERREQLTLELAMIAERKNAKTIYLLEELRRDIPGVKDRHDVEAFEMSNPETPGEILKAIRNSLGKPSTGVDEPPIGKR